MRLCFLRIVQLRRGINTLALEEVPEYLPTLLHEQRLRYMGILRPDLPLILGKPPRRRPQDRQIDIDQQLRIP